MTASCSPKTRQARAEPHAQGRVPGAREDRPGSGESDRADPESLHTWKDVNKSLPATKIEVLGPPPTSGTRDSFAELVHGSGLPQLRLARRAAYARTNRASSAPATASAKTARYIEAGENDNLIVQKLAANKDAVGIFGYSFLEENLDKLKGAIVDGVSPTYETIASGKYPASRPLFIYVKKQHVNVIPGITDFIAEYVSEKALGEEGYLADKGLIPPLKNEIGKIRDDAKALKPLKL